MGSSLVEIGVELILEIPLNETVLPEISDRCFCKCKSDKYSSRQQLGDFIYDDAAVMMMMMMIMIFESKVINK